MIINNLDALMIPLATAVDNINQKLLDKLKEIIQEEIYDAYEPIAYKRTNEFKDSWNKTASKIMGKIVESEIWQEYSMMIWDSEKWQHGSFDRRANEHELADIFNFGLKDMNMDITYNPSRFEATHFWDKFEQYVDANLDNIFAEECGKLGLPINSISGVFS